MLDFLTKAHHEYIRLATFLAVVAFFLYLFFLCFHFCKTQISLNSFRVKKIRLEKEKEASEKRHAESAKLEMERAIQEELDGLSSPEKDLLDLCLIFNNRTITTAVDHPHSVALRSKNLLQTPLGVVSGINTPYTIRTQVWEYLKRHKQSFLQTSKVVSLTRDEQEKRWSSLTSY